jgi:hypothetical protein
VNSTGAVDGSGSDSTMRTPRRDRVVLAAAIRRRAELRQTINLMERWALVFERIGRGEVVDLDSVIA